MARRLSAVAAGLVVLVLGADVHGDEAEDFLRLLEARDNSITSFEIKLRRASFTPKLEDGAAVAKVIEEAARKDKATDAAAARRWVEELVGAWSEDPRWITEHIRQRGDSFREIVTFRDREFVDVKVYDGQLYYDHSQINRQLDIYPKLTNVSHASLQDVGLVGGGLRSRAPHVSLEQNGQGTRCAIAPSDDNPHRAGYEYNHRLGLRHSWYELEGKYRSDTYYLFHYDRDGYSVPRAKVRLYRDDRRRVLTGNAYIIEDVRINCPLTDEDLCLGDVPDRTLVVDRRFGPSFQWRYGEYQEAAANPQIVHAGRCRPEDFLAFLDRTSGRRKAHATRDSRVGHQAPPLHVERWPKESPSFNGWPPEKFTVLNFSGINCGFCTGELPETKELARWLASQGAQFVTIHPAEEKRQAVLDYLDQHQIDYPLGVDEPSDQTASWGSATFADYGISGIPAYVTIAKGGRVLSYDRSPKKERLAELMAMDPDKVAPGDSGSQLPPMAMPKAWVARELAPQSQVEGRFFVFRPETPDLALRLPEGMGEAMTCELTRHSADEQTVYEVRLTTKAADWGQRLAGQVAFVAEHSNVEEQVTIPYTLPSKGLADCACPIVWFGCVEPGVTVTRPLPLQLGSGDKIEISPVSLPKEVTVRPSDRSSGAILSDLSFSSPAPGLHQGELTLLATDARGNRQPIRLQYCAYVAKP